MVTHEDPDLNTFTYPPCFCAPAIFASHIQKLDLITEELAVCSAARSSTLMYGFPTSVYLEVEAVATLTDWLPVFKVPVLRRVVAPELLVLGKDSFRSPRAKSI